MHLSSDELVDLAERSRDESDVPHLRTCDRCRAQLEDLRSALRLAADATVPEPSPLFWPHLSARIQEAVAAERAPEVAGWRGWAKRVPAVPLPLSIGALAAVVLALFVTSRVSAPPHAPAPAAPATSAAVAAQTLEALPDDPALNLVADLAATMTYDEASEIGIGTHAGSVDEALGALSADERQELGRLLKAELKQPGD